jgi:hypothetical protein
MPGPLNLKDARAKRNWADRRLLTLGVETGEWANPDSDPIETGEWEEHPDERYTLIPFARAKPMSDEWPFAVGDIVSNYRAALNYAAYALVLAGSIPEAARDATDTRIQFPIVHPALSHPPTAESFAADGWVHGKLPGVCEKYLRAISPFQPYEARGNEPLNALRVLSNADKHRHPLLMAQVARIEGAISEARKNAEGTPVSTFGITLLPGRLAPEPGTYIARLDWAPGFHPVRARRGQLNPAVSNQPEVGVYLQITAGVAFKDDISGAVTEVLWGISLTLQRVFEALEAV